MRIGGGCLPSQSQAKETLRRHAMQHKHCPHCCSRQAKNASCGPAARRPSPPSRCRRQPSKSLGGGGCPTGMLEDQTPRGRWDERALVFAAARSIETLPRQMPSVAGAFEGICCCQRLDKQLRTPCGLIFYTQISEVYCNAGGQLRAIPCTVTEFCTAQFHDVDNQLRKLYAIQRSVMKRLRLNAPSRRLRPSQRFTLSHFKFRRQRIASAQLAIIITHLIVVILYARTL